MSRSHFKWSFKSLFKLSLNCVLLMPRVESFFKGFLILIFVHASIEISKYIWAILIFVLSRRRKVKGRSSTLISCQENGKGEINNTTYKSATGGRSEIDKREISMPTCVLVTRRTKTGGAKAWRYLAPTCVLFSANLPYEFF
ncbi:uncharacterized protein LOC123425518 isoform X2 [Hordeum vulgare subsp. vulgare]|uniref:uncharacterized protein LOC123425518 isoform X2 n=1 Tax=Hordeum vulgare subsp. vulgare TaxID=112509 RepID=UPI00162D1596|nr:uncharacterized protein LOC123425518 isoform X2 [Hordeum vulgare subsp. vulgare]